MKIIILLKRNGDNMANKTIDQYSLSTSLNDEDLLLVAKYD